MFMSIQTLKTHYCKYDMLIKMQGISHLFFDVCQHKNKAAFFFSDYVVPSLYLQLPFYYLRSSQNAMIKTYMQAKYFIQQRDNSIPHSRYVSDINSLRQSSS